MIKKLIIVADHKEVIFSSRFSNKIYGSLTNLNNKLVLREIKNYEKDYSNEVSIVTMGDSFNVLLTKNKIRYKSYESYTNSKEFEGIESTVRDILTSCKEIFNSQEYEILKFRSISLWEVLDLFLLTKLRKIVEQLKKVGNVLKSESPKEVIILNASEHEKLFFRAAIPKTQPLTFSSNSFIKNSENYAKSKILPKFSFKKVRTKSFKKNTDFDKKKMSEKAFILTDTLRHKKLISPWLKYFEKKHNLVEIVGSSTSWSKNYSEFKSDYQTFDDYLNPEDYRIIAKDSENLFDNWANFDFSSLNKVMRYQEIPIFDLIKDSFLYLVQKIIFGHQTPENNAQIIGFVKLYRSLEKMLILQNPKLFIIHDFHDWFERQIIFFSKINKIPTFMLQHGLITGTSQNTYTSLTNTALFGELDKDNLLKIGYESSQLTVTGSPQWDFLLGKKYDNGFLHNKFGIPRDKKIVLFATEVIEKRAMVSCYINLFNSISRIDNTVLIFKLHPSDPGHYIDDIASKTNFSGEYYIFKNNLHEAIHLSDVLLNFQSSVTIDAIIMGKPVIAINFSGRLARSPYANYDPIITVTEENELFSKIKYVLNDKSFENYYRKYRADFIRKFCYKADGNSSKRVSKLINRLVTSREEVNGK